MRADAKRHREDLIEAARRVFARDGLHAPLQAVVDEARLGRGTLYRHFRDRETLLVAVLEQELSKLSEFLEEWRDQPAFFRDFIRLQGLIASIYSPTMQAMQTMRQERVAELLLSLNRKVEKLYIEVVARAIRSGEVHPSFTITDLKLVVRMLVGASTSRECTPEKAIELATDIILDGVRPR